MDPSSILYSALLGRPRTSNPNAYNTFLNYRSSGKSADQVINELLSSGQISQAQVEQARMMMNGQLGGYYIKPACYTPYSGTTLS